MFINQFISSEAFPVQSLFMNGYYRNHNITIETVCVCVCFGRQVFSTQSVCCPVEGDEAVCVSLPVSGCAAAAFFPFQPARVVVVHAAAALNHKAVSVFDISMKRSRYKQEAQGTSLNADTRRPSS